MTSSPTAGGAAVDRAAVPPTTITGRAAVVAVAVVLIAAFMDLLDATIVSVAAPAIARDLGASEAALQWTLAGYALAIGAGLITGGRIGDQLGRRRVILLGLTGFALASAGCALAPTPEVLISTRVVQGLAGGLMVPQYSGSSAPPWGRRPAARPSALTEPSSAWPRSPVRCSAASWSKPTCSASGGGRSSG